MQYLSSIDLHDDSALCQAWIRLALNRSSGHSLPGKPSYSLTDSIEALNVAVLSGKRENATRSSWLKKLFLGSLVANVGQQRYKLSQLFSTDALIIDEEYVGVVLTIISGLNVVDFQYVKFWISCSC